MDFMNSWEQEVDIIDCLNNHSNMITNQSKKLVTKAANYMVEITVPDQLAENHTAAGTTVSFINWAVVSIHCVEAAIN